MLWELPHEYPKDDPEAAYFAGLQRAIVNLFDALTHPVDCAVVNSCPDCHILAALNGGPRQTWLRELLDSEDQEWVDEDRPLGNIFSGLVHIFESEGSIKLSPGEAGKLLSAYLHKEQTTALLHVLDDETIERLTLTDEDIE